ncbi:MAG: flavodoxin family protein [Angelakisella sp.]
MTETKTVVIDECGGIPLPDGYALDLSRTKVQHCIGCWTCWWTTPGRCAFQDLNEFYHQYITADKAIYFAKVSKGFVSSGLKTLFDRMIPLYLPYISVSTGESMHLPRYEKYPDIEFYYEGDFASDEARSIYENYVHRVFYQFHAKNIVIKPISEYAAKEGLSI